MTTQSLLITALCALSGLSFSQAEDITQAVDPSTAAPKTEAQQTAQPHPFLDRSLYPAWSQMTAERGLADARLALADAREQKERIRSLRPEESTFENVFAAYERMSEGIDQVEGYISHLSSVMDSPELREVQEALIPELSAFSSEVIGDEALWQVIKSAAAQPWVKELSLEKQRYVQQVVDSFRDSGADLSPDKKARRAEIVQELSQLTHQFGKNVLDSTNAWQWVVTDASQLAGMSEDWMTKAAEAALEKGFGTPENPRWLITMDYSSYGDVLKNCTVEATRRKCWEGQCSLGKEGAFDNEPIVARVMQLRRELATLLGFDTYADLTTARRMVGSGQKALAFVDELIEKVMPAFEEENRQILDYVSRCKGEKVEKLNPWDRRFYMHQLARELYDFDPETLRPYQACDRVIQGMFSIFQHLYDIRVEEVPTVCLKPGESCPPDKVEVWHPEVRLFAVYDNKTGAHLGSFYMDLFPRPTKRAGAWVMPMKYGTPAQGDSPHTPHLATLVGNLTPAAGDKPALFSHYDVETIFHEFGHMMHAMLGDTEMKSHCGTSVAWDFVELPSQMNENWTWEPEGIATYAFHYQTGEPIPAEMVKKLISSRFFFPATDNMAQLCLAKLDLEMHMHYSKYFEGKSLDDATNELLRPFRTPTSVEPPSIMRTLTHCITGGYAAGYYSYKWAEVLAADAFTRFQEEGIMNPATGASYRRNILSRGDSKPAAEVYRDFMGRDPNPDALLQKQGLMK